MVTYDSEMSAAPMDILKKPKISKNQIRNATIESPAFKMALPLGVGAGVWAGLRTSILAIDKDISLGIVGAGTVLLGLTVAAMAILVAFLDEDYTPLVEGAGGLTGFYRPLRRVAIISGWSALVALAGAMSTKSGPVDLEDGIFAAAAALFAWAVLASIGLIRILMQHSLLRIRSKTQATEVTVSVDGESVSPATLLTLYDYRDAIERIVDLGAVASDPDVALIYAAMYGDREGVRAALERGSNPRVELLAVIRRYQHLIGNIRPN